MDTRSAVQSVGHSQWSERRYFEKKFGFTASFD